MRLQFLRASGFRHAMPLPWISIVSRYASQQQCSQLTLRTRQLIEQLAVGIIEAAAQCRQMVCHGVERAPLPFQHVAEGDSRRGCRLGSSPEVK